jgi:hypothetical protein
MAPIKAPTVSISTWLSREVVVVISFSFSWSGMTGLVVNQKDPQPSPVRVHS